MPCGCNEIIKDEGPKRKNGPFSQCIFCAQKHADEALCAMNEFAYDLENRSFIHGSLRSIVNHTFRVWPSIASKARKAALSWQNADYAESRRMLWDAIIDIDAEIRRMDPEIDSRITTLEADPVDVIIPLGPGSVDGQNDELKILLRSLEICCTGVGRIIIVTDCPPDWLDPDTVCILPMGDKHDDNKDANLIDKTLAAIEKFNVKSFIWMADDNVIMRPLDLREAPKVFNNRTRSSFTDQRIWHNRMRHTFDVFPQLTCNFDSHTPQPFKNAAKLLQAMRSVNYQAKPGLCIMTAFYAAMGEIDGGIDQNTVKTTAGKDFDGDIDTRLYLGYDDKGFPSIKRKLFSIFYDHSHYEAKK